MKILSHFIIIVIKIRKSKVYSKGKDLMIKYTQ